MYIKYLAINKDHMIRGNGGLLNVATKDQSSLADLPFGEVHPSGELAASYTCRISPPTLQECRLTR